MPRGLIYVAAEAGCSSLGLAALAALAALRLVVEHGQSSAGRHTILLRSDGHAIAFGANEHNQCAVPKRFAQTV